MVGMSPSFTTKLGMLCLLLNLDSVIYFVLFLLKQKPYASKSCLQVLNLPFIASRLSTKDYVVYIKACVAVLAVECVL